MIAARSGALPGRVRDLTAAHLMHHIRVDAAGQ